MGTDYLLKQNESFGSTFYCSYIYARWEHPNDITNLNHYLILWTVIGDDGDRIEQEEEMSDPIPYNSSEGIVLRHIYNIVQGECYDVRVVSVTSQEMRTYSEFLRIQTRKKENFVGNGIIICFHRCYIFSMDFCISRTSHTKLKF